MTLRSRTTCFLALIGVLTTLLSLVPQAVATTVKPSAALSYYVRGDSGPSYVAGQGMILRGTLAAPGVRSVWVESNMNRPGDGWLELANPIRGKTNSDGSFSLRIKAPSMFNISYRVSSGAYATPGVLFNAKTQDIDLWVDGIGQPDYARPVQPLAGSTFTIVADTTPDLYRRPTTDNLPVLVGREVTLWKRTGPSAWTLMGSSAADDEGLARFTGLTEDAGTHVYRVRQEDWTKNGSQVGWHPSWPIAVRVRKIGEAVAYVPEGERTPGNVTGQRGPEAPNANAGSVYRWYPFRWDYAWESGQSLDDRPTRGTDLTGRWDEVSTGLGRVVKHNGGLMVSSGKLVRDGRGDFNSTWALLRGAASTYGRWEATTSLALAEENYENYDAVVQLVPARARDYDCGRHNITVASWSGLDRTMRFGVAAGERQWTGRAATEGPAYSIPIVAVEVGKAHLTWFVNGKPVGSVRDSRAVPNVPLTMRIGLVGDGDEHNNSSFFSDWQRSYPLSSGKQVKTAPALTASPLASCPENR